MKKFLLLMMAAMLLPMAAQALTLEPNQRLMGHYTTDDLNTAGWGKSFMTGINIIGTDITPEELAMFQGSKIVAFRVGLAESAPVSRVFVIPVDEKGNLVNDEMVEWQCEVSAQGWNMIELATPYEINLPDNYSLRIGFDYDQVSRTSKPVSAVKVGTIYPTYHFRNNNWANMGVNTTGNLSLQCITESDNYPEFIVRLADLTCRSNVKVGDDLAFSFTARNLGAGALNAGDVTFDASIDGAYQKTFSNAESLGFDNIFVSDKVNTEGLTEGSHTLTVTLNTIKGQAVANPVTMTATFNVFYNGFSRQKRLVEQFTSTGCTYCPQGSANIQNLCNMRDDIAWISIHENMGNQDPFRTAQTDSITNMEGIDGFPEATFDRAAGISSDNNSIYAIITALPASTMSTFLDKVAEVPSWATVNINSTYDEGTRQAVITIDGELVPNYEDFMGTDSRLTVYITEDGLVAPQVSGGNDYVHNNVLRQALVSVKGVALNKTGNTYRNEFTVDIPTTWKSENLNVVAFVSRPLRSNALTDLKVTNANKRKLGEYDEVTVTKGDVNGDNIVNIDDVTEMIDCLLKGTPASESADCNGDGIVNIDDVTALIDYLLKGTWSN